LWWGTYNVEGNDENVADEDKPIDVYYALHTLEAFDRSIVGEQVEARLLVKQFLPKEERACINTPDGCDISGELTLEGRLTKEPDVGDQTHFEELAKDLYVIDENTLYLDTFWKPSTATSASVLGYVGLGWIGATVAGLFYSIFKRRKKNAPDEAIARDPNIASIQENK
jgi:hypothetical protein